MIENLVPYVFSMNAFYTAFNDKNITMRSVLKGINNAEAILSDKEMGFGSIKSLSKWIKAIEGGDTSETYKTLQDHFGLKANNMDQIVGPKSFLKALYSAIQVSYALEYNCKKRCDNTTMFAIQWSSQNVTNLKTTFISPKVIPQESLFDIDSSLFGAKPEFSYAIKKLGIESEPLNLTQTLGLASIASFEDSASIFNPKNLYDFFSSYLTGGYDNIKIKFKLVSNNQVDALYQYLINYVVPKLGNYEDKKGNKQHKAFAKLVTYTLTNTEKYLQDYFQNELFPRYIGAAMIKEKKECVNYVKLAVSLEKAKDACAKVPFETTNEVPLWGKAFILGKEDDSYGYLSSLTGLTFDDLDIIFSTKNSKYYGSFATEVIKDVSKLYKCSSTPCSKEELAHRQFMMGEITSKIVKYNGVVDYLFEADTVNKWDYWREVSMEFPYFSKSKCGQEIFLTEEIYQILTTSSNRLTNYKNAIEFVINLDHGEKIDYYSKIFKIDSTKLFCVLRYMTQDSLLGGIVRLDPNIDFINGYDDDTLLILREGEFTKGSDPSVQAHISINNIYYNKTLIKDVTKEVFTGNRHSEKVKTTRSVNGGVYINNVIPFYNGTNITYGNLNPYKKNFRIEGTDGLQFGKNLGSKSKPKFFDKNKDTQYKYAGKGSYGKIKTYKYELDKDALKVDYKDNADKDFNYDGVCNISHNFMLPLGSSVDFPVHLLSSLEKKEKVDGLASTVMDEKVENYFQIEPISGFAIDSKRNETLAIDVHEKYLSFPDLDKVNGFIPVMNVASQQKIDEKIFLKRFGFINTYVNLMFLFRVIFYPLAALFFIAAGVFFFLYKRSSAKNIEHSVLDDSFQNENERLIDNLEKNEAVKEKYDKEKFQESTKFECQELEEDSSP